MMACDQAMQVQAYVDGELDALTAADVERHIDSCAECAQLRSDVEGLRARIRNSATYYRASELLDRRVRKALGSDSGRETRANGRPFWLGAVSGGAATALAASLVLAVLIPSAEDQIAQDTLSAHLRSLMSAHLIDVASSNHHVVKPWFAGHVDVSPPVTDFARQGFELVGGRVDYIDGHRAAVLVYRHGAHVANVFVWKDDGKSRPGSTTLNGYHLLGWRSGDLDFYAVSDMAEGELDQLTALIKENKPA